MSNSSCVFPALMCGTGDLVWLPLCVAGCAANNPIGVALVGGLDIFGLQKI